MSDTPSIAPGARVDTRYGGPYHVLSFAHGQLTMRRLEADGRLDENGYATFVGVHRTADGWRAAHDVALTVTPPGGVCDDAPAGAVSGVVADLPLFAGW